MASRSEAYQEKGTVREKGWVTAANGYRPKDSERDKEIQSHPGQRKKEMKKGGEIKRQAGRERDKK